MKLELIQYTIEISSALLIYVTGNIMMGFVV